MRISDLSLPSRLPPANECGISRGNDVSEYGRTISPVPLAVNCSPTHTATPRCNQTFALASNCLNFFSPRSFIPQYKSDLCVLTDHLLSSRWCIPHFLFCPLRQHTAFSAIGSLPYFRIPVARMTEAVLLLDGAVSKPAFFRRFCYPLIPPYAAVEEAPPPPPPPRY